jgi:ankyrin repeat protein
MKINICTLLKTVIFMAVLSTTCIGCFLIPAKHSKNQPIHEYAAAGNESAVEQDIVAHPHDLNLPGDAGETPLDLAVINCHTNVVIFLLNKGAKINLKADGGTTALHLAAQGTCIEAVTLLLAEGVKVNSRDDQRRTPLDRAIQWHRDAIIQLLRQHGGIE